VIDSNGRIKHERVNVKFVGSSMNRWNVRQDCAREVREDRCRDDPRRFLVLPLKDNVPTRTFPIVTVSLIALNERRRVAVGVADRRRQ